MIEPSNSSKYPSAAPNECNTRPPDPAAELRSTPAIASSFISGWLAASRGGAYGQPLSPAIT
jgi:hypothetical protein